MLGVFLLGICAGGVVAWFVVEDHWATYVLGKNNQRSYIRFQGEDYYPLLLPEDAYLDGKCPVCERPFPTLEHDNSCVGREILP